MAWLVRYGVFKIIINFVKCLVRMRFVLEPVDKRWAWNKPVFVM